MSNQDSFINEVSEEVRRDRLYALYRKYGWMAISVVVLIVIFAAANEWRKAGIQADAEAAGNALLSAFEEADTQARAGALAAFDPGDNPARNAVASLAQAAALAEAGDLDSAVTILETVAIDPTAPRVYQELAALKSVMLGAGVTEPDARISRMSGLAQNGSAFGLLALEQIALAEIEAGRTDDAIATLQQIIADAQVTQDLRQRATQLMVSLGVSQTLLAE